MTAQIPVCRGEVIVRYLSVLLTTNLFLYEGRPMNINQEQVIIRYATSDDARQIAEIIVEDWKIAYKGIVDSDFLDSMNVEERYQRELQRYQIYKVAEINGEILGLTWNEFVDNEDSDCEIIALY